MSKTISEWLRIFVFSDPHFGHNRTPSLSTLAAIRRYFPDSPETAKYDICFIPGDFFDHLLNMSDDAVYAAQMAMAHVLRVCAKHDIKLRILEGTRSHDRGQSKHFLWLNEAMEAECDVKYFTTMTLDYMEEYDLNVLYIPDEYHPEAEQTYQQAKDLLHSRGLAKADMAIMHGAWLHQLQGHQSPAYHDAEKWSELVTMNILSGHVHTFSRYLKHISIGSTNRCGHGEEEAKGFLDITYRNKVEHEFRFIENRLAKKYVTLAVYDYTVMDIAQLIEAQNFEKGSAVRLEHGPTDPMRAILDGLQDLYPDYVLTAIEKGGKKEAKGTQGFQLLNVGQSVTPLTEDNLVELLAEHLQNNGEVQGRINHAVNLVRGVMH